MSLPAPAASPDPAPPRLGRSIAIASLYMVATRFVLRGIGLVSTLILVRLLAPDDFGVVGLASAAYFIFDTLTATGFSLALIRMPAPQRVHYDTAWTMSVLRGLVIAVGLVLTAGWQAGLMHDQRIRALMWVLAATALLQSLESVRLIDCQRALRFEVMMRYAVVSKLATFGLVVPLALLLRSYWALTLAGLFGRLLVIIPYSFWLAPYRPHLSLGAWREMFNFSKWLALGNVGVILDLQLMNFVVGRYDGISAVGLYQVVNQVAMLPITEIAAPIRQPAYAGFARIHQDVVQLRGHFVAGLAMQAVLILPLTAGIAIAAPEIVTVFLGQKWATATPLLPAIAVYALFDALGHYIQNVFIALNRQRSYTLTFYGTLLVRLPLTIWAAIHYGVEGAVLAMLATAAANTVLWSLQVRLLLQLSWGAVLAASWRAIAALLALAAAALLARHLPGPASLRLAAEVAAGASGYAGALLLLWLVSGAPETASEAQVLRAVTGTARRLRGILADLRHPA